MKEINILMSGMSYLPRPQFGLLDVASDCEYDGIEVLSNGWNHKRFGQFIERAEKASLKVHAHQPWSYAESNVPDIKSKAMEFIGYLPPSNMPLSQCLPMQPIPKIVYAHQLADAQHDPTLWVQTCPVRLRQGNRTTWSQFKSSWKKEPCNICFDFQHYLEWVTAGDTLGMCPSNFSHLSIRELGDMLIAGFEFFKDYIKEIHLTDSIPSMGHKGLNVMLGTGVLPLEKVMGHIIQSGWKGYIVPEVSPKLSQFFSTRRRAEKILRKTRELIYWS